MAKATETVGRVTLGKGAETTRLLALEEKVDLLCEAVGLMLLCQHGFTIPMPLLQNFCSHLGINLLPQPSAEQMQ